MASDHVLARCAGLSWLPTWKVYNGENVCNFWTYSCLLKRSSNDVSAASSMIAAGDCIFYAHTVFEDWLLNVV